MKVLIFHPFGIGDVLFTTPLIRNLKNNLPEAEIFYLSDKRVYPILQRNKFLNKVFILEKDEWRQSLKESKFSFFL
ncbi:MAG: hypothetical protein KAS99_02665 [Candidatus Omnitrophica bacterium]|nr:hypothetical protein [Candidatus Omnitrophota bacterium]